MKLVYYNGENFGDALNPYILERLFPDFFDEELDHLFIGIGSILGLNGRTIHHKAVKKRIVFTSGYAAGNISIYGKAPKIDENWDVRCVRGPLTAKLLNLDKKLAVADGAVLMHYLYHEKAKKRYPFSYMPHHASMDIFNGWEKLLESCSMHLIDPRKDIQQVLKELSSTECLITEALHGAIVADALRIPWFGVKTYPHINEFKWNDWGQSLKMGIELSRLPSVYPFDDFKKTFHKRTKSIFPDFVASRVATYVDKKRQDRFVKMIEQLKSHTFYLSNEYVLCTKCEQLMEIAEAIFKEYSLVKSFIE